MGGELKDQKLMKLFLRAIDPYGERLLLKETEDGFITNGHWAVKKELMEPFQYQSYVRGVLHATVHSVVEDILRKDEERAVEKNVAVYDDFEYYAVRTEVVNGRKLNFYVLDVPVLFKKVLALKKYVDFIDAAVGGISGGGFKRRLYYVEVLKKAGNKEVRPYFVWYQVNGEDNDVVAICTGYSGSDKR
jgi:hypothetical protein